MTVQPIRRNPGMFSRRDALRWRLVLWLTGGTVEAVPMLHGPVCSTETVVVTLGQPGHLNTVERKP